MVQSTQNGVNLLTLPRRQGALRYPTDTKSNFPTKGACYCIHYVVIVLISCMATRLFHLSDKNPLTMEIVAHF